MRKWDQVFHCKCVKVQQWMQATSVEPVEHQCFVQNKSTYYLIETSNQILKKGQEQNIEKTCQV